MAGAHGGEHHSRHENVIFVEYSAIVESEAVLGQEFPTENSKP
jgi:hypothetical protein